MENKTSIFDLLPEDIHYKGFMNAAIIKEIYFYKREDAMAFLRLLWKKHRKEYYRIRPRYWGQNHAMKNLIGDVWDEYHRNVDYYVVGWRSDE